MVLKRFVQTILLLLNIGEILASHEDLEVSVSRGVMVNTVSNVILYTEQQYLYFYIPDLPDLPELTSSNCAEMPYTESCAVTANLNDINHDSLLLLSLLNRMMTKKGLNDMEVSDQAATGDSMEVEDNNTSRRDSASENVIAGVGMDWYRSLNQRLNQRKVSGAASKRSARTERAAGAFGAAFKGLTAAAALFGMDDLFSFTKDLFVGKNQILSIITGTASHMPVDRREFARVVQRTSEFETFTKAKFTEIIQDNRNLKNLTNLLDEELRNHRLDISIIQEGYSQSQKVMADVTTLLFNSILYFVQINAFNVCRSKELPLLYVPPELLQNTLADLQDSLPDDIEFAIPLSHISLYYTMTGMCNCLYDDDGGTIRLSIPLKTKDAVFQLFETKPIQFAWQNMTCVLELDASFVVKEKNSKFVFPVTSVDIGSCDPVNNLHCKVPGSTSDDTTSSCVSLILSGASTQEIKNGCRIKCAPHNRPEVSKVSNYEFIATHIQPGTLVISCPSENRTITQVVEYGALYLSLPCMCRLFLHGKVIYRSTKSTCSEQDTLKVENLLPAHFLTSQDIIHFSEQDKEMPRFRHKDEIFNADFLTETLDTQDDSLVTTKLNVFSATWNIIQSLVIAYSFFKMHTLSALVLQLTQGIGRAQASTNHTCKLPYEAYVLLIAILVVTVIGVIPQMIFFMWKMVKRVFWETVEMEAQKLSIKKSNVNIDILNQSKADKDGVVGDKLDHLNSRPPRKLSYDSFDSIA